MDPRLKRLTEELSAAINEGVAAVIGEIQRDGYDVFLFLNATIGLRQRAEESVYQAARSGGEAGSGFTSQDMKFLKSLHISMKN